MADSTTTPNMGLIVPTVGQDPGPDWANNINASLGILDEHNHSSGQGVQITPAGININADLPFNGNNAISLKTVRFNALSAPLAGTSPNLGCVYVSGNELYYNDEVGHVVQITNVGSVNAGAGSITGLPSGTASASYNSGSATFIWQSATSTPANMDFGSAILRNITANSHGLTLSPPSALAADYSLVFPLVPSGFSLMSLDTSGNMGTLLIGQGLQNVSGTLEIPNQGVTQAMLAPRTTGSTVAAGGYATSASCGNASVGHVGLTPIPNFSVTITTTGRPVVVGFISDGSTTNSVMGLNTSASSDTAVFVIKRGSTAIVTNTIESTGPVQFTIPPSSMLYIDTVAAGTYTYTGYYEGGSATVTAIIQFSVLFAYEM
jgi:hypothetical protein